MPEVKAALSKMTQDLDGLQTTITRANDLLNDKNRANLGATLDSVHGLLADTRPRVATTLDNLNGLLTDTRPQLAATLTDVRGVIAKLTPVLDDLKVTTTKANDLLTHVDAVMVENRADIRTSVDRVARHAGKVSGAARPVECAARPEFAQYRRCAG